MIICVIWYKLAFRTSIVQLFIENIINYKNRWLVDFYYCSTNFHFDILYFKFQKFRKFAYCEYPLHIFVHYYYYIRGWRKRSGHWRAAVVSQQGPEWERWILHSGPRPPSFDAQQKTHPHLTLTSICKYGAKYFSVKPLLTNVYKRIR